MRLLDFLDNLKRQINIRNKKDAPSYFDYSAKERKKIIKYKITL